MFVYIVAVKDQMVVHLRNCCFCDPVLRSGGCGAMYEIHIESSEFKGKRTIQQHQLVNQVTHNNSLRGVLPLVV